MTILDLEWDEIEKFDPNQARDERGRWSKIGGTLAEMFWPPTTRRVVDSVAAELGVNPDQIKLKYTPWIAAGSATHSHDIWEKAKINIWPIQAQLWPGGLRSVVAHEAMHARTHDFFTKTKKGKAWINDNFDALHAEGSVSPYSKLYWDLFERVKGQAQEAEVKFRQDHDDMTYMNALMRVGKVSDLAVNETLSEMAAIKQQTGELPGGPKFKKLYNAVLAFKAPERPVFRVEGNRAVLVKAAPAVIFSVPLDVDSGGMLIPVMDRSRAKVVKVFYDNGEIAFVDPQQAPAYQREPVYLAGFMKACNALVKEDFDESKHPRGEHGRFARSAAGRTASWVKEKGGSVLSKAVAELKDPENAKAALAVAIGAALSAIGKMDQGNIQDMAVRSEVDNFAANARVARGRAKEIMQGAVDGLLKLRKKKIEKAEEDEIAALLERLKEVLERLPDDAEIEKAYNPNEPRDAHGRWEELTAGMSLREKFELQNARQDYRDAAMHRYYWETHPRQKAELPPSHWDEHPEEVPGRSMEEFTQIWLKARTKKMVPYAEARPYMREDAYIAGRAGAADGRMKAEALFSERAALRPSGPGQRGMKDPKRQRLAVGETPLDDLPAPRVGHRFDNEAPISGDDMVPGSRLRVMGRRRTL